MRGIVLLILMHVTDTLLMTIDNEFQEKLYQNGC